MTDRTGPAMNYFYIRLFGRFSSLSWQARAAWVSLCFFASWNETRTTGKCWPSHESLAAVLGLSKATIRRGLGELKKLGLIKCISNNGGTCRYVLLAQGCALTEQGAALTEQGGCSHRATNNTINIKNNINDSGTFTPEMFEALFDGLWMQYSRFNPDGRAEARLELSRLFPIGTPLDEIGTRQEKLIDMLNEQGGIWEENLNDGSRRFNPRMGNWLKRQFGECLK